MAFDRRLGVGWMAAVWRCCRRRVFVVSGKGGRWIVGSPRWLILLLLLLLLLLRLSLPAASISRIWLSVRRCRASLAHLLRVLGLVC
jgi:hypothetical protein